MHPLISVLLPVYNEGPYIRECLESIVSQRNELVEICISDNASDDNTWEIISDFMQKYPRVSAVRQSKGIHPFENIQRALDQATGSYVYLLGGDDYVLPGVFDEALMIYSEIPDLKAFILKVNYFDDKSKNIFATFPPEYFQNALIGTRTNLVRFVSNHINHDELVLGFFKRKYYEQSLKLIQGSTIEPSGLWIFLSIVLSDNIQSPKIRISEKPYLMKRYGKPSIHEFKFTTSANIMEQKSSWFKNLNQIFQFNKMIGSLITITMMYKKRIITWNEMLFLLMAPKYHDEYGLCFLGPILHPLWRMIRGLQYCSRMLKHKFSNKPSFLSVV